MVIQSEYSTTERILDRVATIEFWDNDIVYFKLADNTIIDVEDSNRLYNFLASKYDGNSKFLVLVESGKFTEVTKEAREVSAKRYKNSVTLATAIINKTLAQRLIINFLINFTSRYKYKMRLFNNREKAIEWLHHQKTLTF